MIVVASVFGGASGLQGLALSCFGVLDIGEGWIFVMMGLSVGFSKVGASCNARVISRLVVCFGFPCRFVLSFSFHRGKFWHSHRILGIGINGLRLRVVLFLRS